MAELLDPIAEQATQEKLSYVDFLDRLLEAESVGRAERRLLAKTRLAHFPFIKSLADFDFSFQPSIDRKQIQELATLRFLAHGENVIFLGPPGVGKTHLAVALGMEAVARGRRLLRDRPRAARAAGPRRPGEPALRTTAFAAPPHPADPRRDGLCATRRWRFMRMRDPPPAVAVVGRS